MRERFVISLRDPEFVKAELDPNARAAMRNAAEAGFLRDGAIQFGCVDSCRAWFRPLGRTGWRCHPVRGFPGLWLFVRARCEGRAFHEVGVA
jgi:hypothetical protein